MQILKDSASVRELLATSQDQELRELIATRVQELSEYDDYDLGELVHFYVVESADELCSLSLPEYIDVRVDHSDWTELIYVISDDGFGLQVYVRRGLI
jgi:hypothetical protein